MREQRKVLVGRVTSNRMDKTVVVEVRQRKRHRLYGKVINVRKRFKAHDEENACQVGDEVRTIDWNVTARHGHPYVKVYREERELTVLLLVDGSGSFDFRVQPR